MLDKIKCKCQTEYDEENLKSHFSQCVKFKEAFREFDKEYGKLLKKYSQPAENLPILKFLLKQYTVVIDDKIKKMKIDVSGSRAPDDSPNKDNIIAPSFRRDDAPEKSRINNHNLEQVQRVNQNINPDNDLSINYENRNEIINNDCNNDQQVDNLNHGNNKSNTNLSSRLELPDRENHEFQHNPNYFMKENRFNMDFNNSSQNDNLFDSINKESSNVDNDFTYADKNNYGGAYKYHDDYIREIQPEIDKCMCCDTNEDLLPLECFHMICNRCFLSLVEKDTINIRCKKPYCNKKVQYLYLQTILGEEKLTHLEKLSVDKIVNEFGQGHNCPGCGEFIIFEKGEIDYEIKDENNQIVSRQEECFFQNRCKCPRCQKEFCINCKLSPFHLGKTCEEQKKFKEAKQCTSGDSKIKSNNPSGDSKIKSNNQLSSETVFGMGAVVIILLAYIIFK